MTQTLERPPLLIEAADQLIALLERHHHESPALSEALTRHQALAGTLVEQRGRGEQTLSAWRQAVAQRWACEVAAQRVYRAVQIALGTSYGNDPSYDWLLTLTNPGHANTPHDLLQAVRRLEASLELLTPQPPFARQEVARLRVVGDALDVAIERTNGCEAAHRQVLVDQRLTTNLLKRALERAHTLLASHTNR